MFSSSSIASGRLRGLIFFPYAAVVAVLQLLWAGYRFGAGNQSIQLPFLVHLRDPGFFARDALLSSLPSYPGVLLPFLARAIPGTMPMEPVFLLLHLLTTALALAASCHLCIGLGGRRRSGFLLLALLAAGHHAGLSESGLYAQGFSHTWAGYALGVLALALAVNGRERTAFVLAGLLLHVHALIGGFVGLMLGAWSLAALPRRGLPRMVMAWMAGLLVALTALVPLIGSAPALDAEWVRLVRIRSAHHVFPSSWWRVGDARIARFALLAGFAALGWSLNPPPRRREARALMSVPVVLGILGTVFVEGFPVASVMRAQLFRSSGFLVLLMLIWMVRGADRAVRLAACLLRSGKIRPAAVAWGILFVLAGAVFSVGLPAMAGMQAVFLFGGAMLLLRYGRLSVGAAALTGIAILVGAASSALLSIPFVVGPGAGWAAGPVSWRWALLPAASGVALVYLLQRSGRPRSGFAAGLLVSVWLASAPAGPFQQQGMRDAAWVDVQQATRRNTPRDALILTPTVPGGFRIHARRAVVAEWRDGTQQFFDPAFAGEWWRRMERIRLGLAYSDDGRRLLRRGGDLEDLPEEEILAIAHETGATHVVLPVSRQAALDLVYANTQWALYRARTPPLPPAPEGFLNEEAWEQQQVFLRETVLPNIERHRKSDVTLRLVDATGRPLWGHPFRLNQVDSLFGFGSAFGHFLPPAAPSRGFDPGIVDPREFERFREIFNYSIIGFSGKWDSIEPVRGQPDYRALDAYVDACTRHGIGLEYHFVSGYPPGWMQGLEAGERQAEFLRHAEELMERYGERIENWQVVNERHLVQDAPAVIRRFREHLPGAALGTSDCARWHTGRDRGRRGSDLLRGLSEVRWLAEQGTAVDFFGFHGHRPFGLWADLRVMYETFDACLEAGVRVHISEFGIPRDAPIVGDLRTGQWNAELQAEYYRLVFTVAFSHPAVDAINLWGMGPRTWIPGAGLLDENYEPLPAFDALKTLITETWRTSIEGVLPLDGRLAFRGFHGPYRMEVTIDGEPVEVAFDLTRNGSREIRLVWDADARRFR